MRCDRLRSEIPIQTYPEDTTTAEAKLMHHAGKKSRTDARILVRSKPADAPVNLFEAGPLAPGTIGRLRSYFEPAELPSEHGESAATASVPARPVEWNL
jgi:hypothetical protein